MTHPTFNEEQMLWNQGYEYVVGIDEVGRGCFAGPLMVGAVIFPKGYTKVGNINDSKLLSADKRETVAKEIYSHTLLTAIAEVSVEEINTVGIGKATQTGYSRVLQTILGNTKYNIPNTKYFILMDAFYIKNHDKTKQKPIIKGDTISASIAAASVIAKVYRDNLMKDLHSQFEHYNFLKNKGYGTKDHREAIRQYGLCGLHRTSFNLEKFLY